MSFLSRIGGALLKVGGVALYVLATPAGAALTTTKVALGAYVVGEVLHLFGAGNPTPAEPPAGSGK